MQISIIGLPQSGKSTLFEIMTGIGSKDVHGKQYVKGIAKVPDERFSKLVEIFKPAKISPATVPFIDITAVGEDSWDAARQIAGAADALLHVIDGFLNPSKDKIIASYKKLSEELILSDLILVEKRIARLAKLSKQALKAEEALQNKILPEAKKLLESGIPLRELTLSQDESMALKGFSFWTLKPELVVINIAEGGADPSADFKAEIAALDMDERAQFLSSMNIETPAFEKIIQTSFSLLGRVSYFTVGEDEVKAWVIPAGSTAPKAAAAIHNDFERGFIKAEVTGYEDFINCGATMAAAKSAGKVRLEGKEYIVLDGDIISFRFNV
jgi:ribosome-binding ATPase YchF (GTP1/OBG family)